MAKIFDCKNCEQGIVDANDFVVLQIGGCSISSLAYPCNNCGRLHRSDGSLVNTKEGAPLFSKEGTILKG
ncbi:MAG: hypothetical protein PHI53_03640 [Candidatus Pacebacteria bacterium]|nr:hypothetical protein [Candidatus Paceibacterota bacterium]